MWRKRSSFRDIIIIEMTYSVHAGRAATNGMTSIMALVNAMANLRVPNVLTLCVEKIK